MRTLHVFATLSLLGMLATPAFATSSRVAAMGGGDDYFEDVNNVLRWYGSLASYGGTALFEYQESRDSDWDPDRQKSATLIADLGPDGRWGVGGLFLFDEDPDDVLRLAWGRRLGPVQIGFQFRSFWESVWTSYQGSSEPMSVTDWTYGLGARWELGPRAYLDAAGELIRAVREVVPEDADPETSSGSDSFGMRIRLFKGLSDVTAVVPLLEYRRFIHTVPSFEGLGTSGVYDMDRREISLGVGWNHLPDDDTLLVGSFTYGHHDTGLRNARYVWDVQAFDEIRHRYHMRFGVERRMLSWLTLRAGVWQRLESIETRRQVFSGMVFQTSETDEHDMALSLGAAVHVGPFDADLVLNDQTPFNLGGFVAQTPESGSTWNRITLQYVF